jgi:hypothetical protein
LHRHERGGVRATHCAGCARPSAAAAGSAAAAAAAAAVHAPVCRAAASDSSSGAPPRPRGSRRARSGCPCLARPSWRSTYVTVRTEGEMNRKVGASQSLNRFLSRWILWAALAWRGHHGGQRAAPAVGVGVGRAADHRCRAVNLEAGQHLLQPGGLRGRQVSVLARVVAESQPGGHAPPSSRPGGGGFGGKMPLLQHY